MKAVVDEISVQFKGKFNVVRIDINKQTKYFTLYNIDTIPITVVYDVDGNQIARLRETVARDALITALKQAGVP